MREWLWWAFIGSLTRGLVTNHKDGDKHNNTVLNLEYVSPRDNDRHASSLGLKAHGERHGSAKLTADDVRIIRTEYEYGMTCSKLAAHFDVSPSTIERAAKGQTWSHV